MDKIYKFKDVNAATGASHSQVMWWSRMGWLDQPKGDGRGSRAKKEYSHDNLVRIALLRGLMNAGVPAKSASETVNIARHLLKTLKRHPVDIFAPGSRPTIEANLYLLHLVNMTRSVYVSVAPKERSREGIEYSPQVNPTDLKGGGQDLAHDPYKVPPSCPVEEHTEDALIFYKAVINLNSVMKGVYLVE